MHPACHSMQVLFMTDGKPSDPVDARVLPGALAEALRVLHEACPKVSVQLLGFGEADTRTLEAMVAALPGGVASCNLVRNDVATLQQSVSTFSNSVSVSRISSVANHSGPRRPLRRINRSLVERREVYAGCEVYLPPKKLGSFEGELRRLPKLHEIEISNRLFGYGGERNAYEARFITKNGFTSSEEVRTHAHAHAQCMGMCVCTPRMRTPCLRTSCTLCTCTCTCTFDHMHHAWCAQAWIVKESRYEKTLEEEDLFHRKSLITQK